MKLIYHEREGGVIYSLTTDRQPVIQGDNVHHLGTLFMSFDI